MKKILSNWPKGIYLLISISLFVFVIPLFVKNENKEFLNAVSFSLILLSLFSIIKYKNYFGDALIILSVISVWLMYFLNHGIMEYFAFSFAVLVFILASFKMISQIIKSKNVDVKLIVQTINGYLLLGVIFTFINTMLFWYNPDAISFSKATQGVSLDDIIYYSYVSMTTIGYGEITPLSSAARSISMLSAIIGQLYLAIIMAFIIGKFLNQKKENEII